MAGEPFPERCIQNGKEIAALTQSLKSAHKRIDENDRITEGIHRLAANVEAMALQVKLLTERMDATIARLEERLEQSAARHDAKLKEQGERIGALEKEPAGKWKALVSQVIAIVVAGFVGGFLSNFIN